MTTLSEFSLSVLSSKKVIAIGAGGLAHAALPYLIASGLSNWIIYDGDVVTEAPRLRQWLFQQEDLGRPKASCLASRLGQKFPHISVLAYDTHYAGQAVEADLVFDFTDRLKIKAQLAHFFFKSNIPVVYAAAFANSGSVALIGTVGVKPLQVFPTNQLELANADCEVDGVWPTTVAAVGIHASEVAIDFLTKGQSVLDRAIDYYNAEEHLWTRFRFEAQVTPSVEIKEEEKDLDPNAYRWINLGHEPVIHSKVIHVLANETEHFLKEQGKTVFGVFCETGAKADLLAKRFPNQLVAWKKSGEELIRLLHD